MRMKNRTGQKLSPLPFRNSAFEIRIFRCTISIALLSIFCLTAAAQDAEQIAQQEVARRQASLVQGQAALTRAKVAMRERNFAAAHDEYRNALALFPDAVISDGAHQEAVDGFCESGVKLAEQRIAEGRQADAESILREVMDNRYAPSCGGAAQMLARMGNVGSSKETAGSSSYVSTTTNTMGPRFAAKVEEVKTLLADAQRYYDEGRYDLAFKKYDQVLALDPYNTAARKGQEKIDLTRYQYNQQAYNETRARQLWQVEKGWEEPVKQYGPAAGEIYGHVSGNISDTALITSKLNSIIIPKIEFRDASIREAIDFVRQQAAANDETPDGKKGVNIVLRLVPLGQVAPPAGPTEARTLPSTGTVTASGGPTETAPPITARASGAASGSPAQARITLSLTDIPLGEALRYIANQAGLKVKIEPYAVMIIPISEQSTDLITKRYRVPPEFFGGPLDVGYYLSNGLGGGEGEDATAKGAQAAPVATNEVEKNAATFQNASSLGAGTAASSRSTSVETTLTTRQRLVNDRQLVGRADAKTFLQSMGVSFAAPGSSATFFPHTGTLIVRNTVDNLDVVDALVDQANTSAPKQVEIESKFIEITQNNLKELGFDWLLGPFNIGNHKVFGGGGTIDNASIGTFPFVDANGNVVAGPGTSIGPNPNRIGSGGGPVTAGNRSGGFAISANALDALLFPTGSGAAPGIFGLAGVFTDPQFQVVIRALNQKKGIDLLSAPKVTTKSGQRAIIEVVREFRYPTDFTPPQVPSISSSSSTVLNGVVPVVVTPTTPRDWETRNTGVTLEVEPVIASDGSTIDLNLIPQVTEFEGFINYGSPINAIGVNTTMNMITRSAPITLTENVINQPIFSTRKVTTSVAVADGQTVVLGGLMREDVQKVEDKTPIIGDIPLVGRLFRSNIDQHVKRNLIIFVTAKKVTAYGEVPEDQEEELMPPVLPEQAMYKK